jgi:transposase
MPKVDIITGEQRHRRWTIEEKQSIVAAAFSPGIRPMDIAKRANISSGQLYTWRKELLEAGVASFSRVVAVTDPVKEPKEPVPAIELEINGHRVRIPASMPPALASAVVLALVNR